MDRLIHPQAKNDASCCRYWGLRVVPVAHRVTANTTNLIYIRDDGHTAVDGG
jgi:hypothetical protein